MGAMKNSGEKVCTNLADVQIGIVIAAYNAEITLARAIESVLRQTVQNWQMVIVDDGSTDNTLEIAQKYSGDTRIRCISQQNKGAAAARNAGIMLLSTPWICYLDADDEFVDEYLSEQILFMSTHPGYDIYSPNGIVVHADERQFFFSSRVDTREVSIGDMIDDCVMLGGGTLFSRDAFLSVSGFREHIYVEDYDLWLRLLSIGRKAIAYSKPLYIYHLAKKERKSDDWLTGNLSAVAMFEEMLGHSEADKYKHKINEAIKSRKALIKQLAYDQAMDQQAEKIKLLLTDKFGETPGLIFYKSLKKLAWLVRPARKLFARLRS